MGNEYLKNLVKEIKKQAIIGAPGSTPAGGGGGGGGAPRAGGGDTWSGQGGTGVMGMQHAIQDFAADVSKQLDIQKLLGDPNGREYQEAKHRDAFGVFLTKNYMRNTKVPGVEFDPNPAARKVTDKSPDDPTRMSVVMDTMNRIGHETSERFVDGNWGPRTNAAVRDVYAFAAGLFDMVDDINRFSPQKIELQSYSKESLKNLEGMATPDDSLTQAQKVEAAPLVTRHVKAIQAAYDELKNKVLQNRTYRQFIEGDVPYKSYGPATSPQDMELLKKYFQNGLKVTIPDVIDTYIDFDSLTSIQKFKQWINRAAPEAYSSGKLPPEKVLEAIEKDMYHQPEPGNTSVGPLSMPSKDPGY